MTNRLEHVNVTVRDSARTAEMLCAIFGWTIRWHGPTIRDGYSHHVGADDDYIALYAPSKTEKDDDNRFVRAGGLNHIGVVVDDLEAVEQRVIDAGLKPYSHQEYEPGRRFYFFDNDNIEYEVVSYD